MVNGCAAKAGGASEAQIFTFLPAAGGVGLTTLAIETAMLLREGVGILLRTLYPITPHVAHVLWGQLGYSRELGDLLDAPMPLPAEDALRQDEVELVVQVNGKLRGRVIVAAQATEEAIKAAALADEQVRKFVDKPVRKVVYVPGKLINIVV